DEQFVGGQVVLVEPVAEPSRGLEEDRLRRLAPLPHPAQSRPASSSASGPSSGFSPVSWRRRLIRSRVGGWVENRPLARCSNFLIGFVKYMCCVARFATSSTSWSSEIFASARSIPYGFRVRWTD